MGFFGRKKPEEERKPESRHSGVAPAPDPESPELETAVDTIAEMLRVFGAESMWGEDSGSFKATCEAWAQHLLVYADPPSTVGMRSEKKERQWRNLRRVFAQLRKSEVASAVTSASIMRDALWSFIRVFARVLSADGTTDLALAAQLARLRVAVAAPELDLRREVSDAVEAIESAMREKQAKMASESSLIADRVRALSDELETAKKEGATDALTKVANRKTFDEELEHAHELAVLGAPATLLMVDIDFFKKVNDAHGHQAGDQVLRAVADALVRSCRRRRDFVARYGGEEFAVLLPETSLEESRVLVERACDAVRALDVVGARVTISVGAATAMRGESKEGWLARADRALYEAKATGRNRAVFG